MDLGTPVVAQEVLEVMGHTASRPLPAAGVMGALLVFLTPELAGPAAQGLMVYVSSQHFELTA